MNSPTNVQFDSDQTSAMAKLYKNQDSLPSKGFPGLKKILINSGLAKNDKAANGWMVFITIVFLAAAVYIFYRGYQPVKVNPIGWDTQLVEAPTK